jgi:hypothetical protein
MSMGNSLRRTVGVALGAMVASPIIALLVGTTASADPSDLAYVGPLTFDGYTDALTYNTSTYAFDNLLTGSSNLVPFDVDAFYGAPGSGDSGFLLTIPLIYQGGFTDIDGTFTPISSFDSADFLSVDQGLLDLGGTLPTGLDVESFNLSSLLGYDDVFSINTSTLAIDNYLDGVSSGLGFDFDISYGDASSFDAVFTVPALFQAGIEDIGGVMTPLFSLNPADFVAPDLGLSLIGG